MGQESFMNVFEVDTQQEPMESSGSELQECQWRDFVIEDCAVSCRVEQDMWETR
jgi:hypothetical protein